MKHLLVKDWMTTDVLTATPSTRMLEAHKMMRDKHVRRLPVVKKNGKLVGIVTRSDIRRAEPSQATSLSIWEINYLLAQLELKDVMTEDILTIRPDDTIKTAAMMMHDKQIGALPVTDTRGRLVGIITESDIFRILVAWFNEEVAETPLDG